MSQCTRRLRGEGMALNPPPMTVLSALKQGREDAAGEDTGLGGDLPSGWSQRAA